MTAIRTEVVQQYSYRTFWLILLLVACFIFGLIIIELAQRIRVAHATVAELEQRRDDLHNEWTQLLLEYSVLASEGQVDKVAREVLNMRTPEKVTIIKIPKE